MALFKKNKIIFLLLLTQLAWSKQSDVWLFPTELSDLVEHGLEHQDWAYKYGASMEGKTDCSYLIQKIFKAINIELPRSSSEQSQDHRFIEIKWEDRQMGDLIFFHNGRRSKRISHVGILVDEDRMLHASRKKRKVIISKITPERNIGKKIVFLKRYKYLFPEEYMHPHFYF